MIAERAIDRSGDYIVPCDTKESPMLRNGTCAIATGAIVALILTCASPSRAEVFYPWCIQYRSGKQGIGATSCGFVTLAQCMASASGMRASCVENPADPPERQDKTHSRYRHSHS